MSDLTPEQRDLVAAVKDFAGRECATREQRLSLTDGDEEPHSHEIAKKMAEAGWLGIGIPEEYGGSGGELFETCLFIEQITQHRLPITTWAITSIVGATYRKFATEEVKHEVLGGIARGAVESIAMSEPGSGSDVASLSTRAEPVEGGYVVNGQKTWCSNAHLADHILVVVRTSSGGGKHDGLTMLSIPAGTPGMEVRQIATMGGREVNDIFFADCFVPIERLVGVEGQAWAQLIAGLNIERVIIGALYTGMAQRAFDQTVAYVQQREQFGQPVGSFQALSQRLADLATEVTCSRLLYRDVARKVDRNPEKLLPREASMAKLKASELAKQACLEGVQMMGGAGYATEFDMESLLRAAVVGTIVGGTSGIQRDLIAKTYGL
ncbi:acyl-CoA dehydrogenase family protein [Nocardioides stalactiti]|uniref:acyl-CoA dehydrogenase family protein n=1 Tax=Nocardioides stalactiti TaxID=2755356 RepID=UPI0015FEC409|nr:acyl-CoA dehydrogenase family protein [Nocardioides stalactiti]